MIKKIIYLLIVFFLGMRSFEQTIQPAAPSFCAGGSVTLSVSPTTGITGYVWLDGASPVGTSSSYNASTTGSYSVRLSRQTRPDTTIGPVTVTQNPIPVANFTFPATTDICSGTPINFTSASTGGTPPYTYAWDFGDGTSAIANPSHAFTSLGCGTASFSAKLTITDSKGCTNTVTKTFIIKQAPDVQLEDPVNDFRNCDNHPTTSNSIFNVTVNNISPSAACISTYSINWGDNSAVETGLTAASFPRNHTYSSLGVFTLSVSATGTNNCSNTKKYTVANQSNPGALFGTLGATTGKCIPDSIPFVIGQWEDNSPGTIYNVNFGDGTEVTLEHPLNPTAAPDTFFHTYTTTSCPGSTSFTATLNVINACDLTPYTAGNIKFGTKPLAGFTAPDSGCVGKDVCFINTTTQGFGNNCSTNISYSWNFGDGSATSTAPEPCHIFTSPGVYIVALTASNIGCGASVFKDTICITDIPTPGFTTNTLSGCAPLSITTTNTTGTANSCQVPTYSWRVTYTAAFCETDSSWQFGAGSSDTSTSPSFLFKNAGTYTIVLSVKNACGTFTTSQTINVQKPPTVTITPPVYPCGPVTITPAATVASCGTGALSYKWTFAGGVPDTAITANPGTVIFSTVGTHLITLAVTNECGTTTATQSVTVTAVPDVIVPPDQNKCGGETVGPLSFSSTVGTPVYNWTNNNTSIGLAASGTGSIPSFTAINNGTAPVIATIIVTPFVSAACSGIPDTFTITVNPRPAAPPATTQFFYCLNATASALTAAPDAGNTLTWYTNAGLTGGSPVAPTPPTTVPGVTTYYVTQKNSGGCESPATVITVTVNPSITGNTIAADQNICENSIPAAITTQTAVGGGTGTYNFSWQSSTDGGTTWITVAGASSESYPPPALLASTKYRRIVGSSTCSDTSNIITVTVQGALTNYNIAATQTICSGEVPDTLTGGIPTGGGGSYTYLWESSTDNINWIATGSAGQNFQPAALQQTTFFRRRVSASQCAAVSNVIEITVKPLPAASLTVPIAAICTTDVGSVSFTATSGTAPFTIELSVSRSGQPDVVLIQTVNSNGPATIQVINVPGIPGRYTVTLTKITDANGCQNNSGNIAKDTIDVISPIVNIIQKDSIICAGQSLLIQNQQLSGGSATGLDSLYTYQWESAPTGTTNWQPVLNATEATLTVSPVTSTCYRRKVKSNNLCESVSNQVCITVNATIGNNIITASQGICVNIVPALLTGGTPTGGDNNYVYEWQTTADNENWVPVIATINYQPGAFATDGIYYFRRNVSSGGCTASSNVIAITVKPDTKALFTANPTTVCNKVDLAGFITVTPFSGNDLYQWYAGGVLFGSDAAGIFPGYTIQNAGDTVIIKLVTTSQFGCKADSVEQQFISVLTAQANFTKDTSSGCGPLPVTFTNTSNLLNGIQFFWDFGNGQKSTETQPGIISFESSPFFTDTTYQVSLKAYNGCDTTIWRDSVTVRANPKARFGVDTTFGCSPFTVKINNTSPGGPNTYYWDFGDGKKDTTFTNGLLEHLYNTGPAVDTFTIRLIAENQCRRDTQAINIRIAPNPIQPLINVNSSELFGCAAHTVVFNNTTFGATKFSWNYGDGSAVEITNNTQDTIRHTYTAAGIFTVAIDITNGCSDTTVFRQITVYPRPSAAFTTDQTTYCEGDTIKVTNSSTNATNYQWFWGDGTASAELNPVHVYKVSGDYNILLHAEQSNTSGVVCLDSLTVPITVLAQPVVTVQSNINTVNCAPFTLNVAAPGITNENITWYFYDSTVTPSLITSNNISASYTFNKPGTFYVKLLAANARDCKDSAIISFTVRGKATASFTPGDLAACTTDTTVSFINTSTYNGNDPVSYQWLVDNAPISNSANFTHQYSVLPATTLPKIFTTSLIVSNTVGCSDTADAKLQINPLARAGFNITNGNGCAPFQLGINNTSVYATSYNWLVNGVSVSNDSIPFIIIREGAKLYNITLIADNIYGCKPDTFQINLTSRAKPVASFTLADTLGCNGQLSVFPTNLTTGASSYVWSWGDGNTDRPAKTYTHLYTSQGQYLITLVASDGVCTDTTQQLVKVSVKPVADFSVNQTLTCDTARVQFSNLTTDGASYVWSFGDGTFSNAIDPAKSYAPNTIPYTVKLVAASAFGCKDSVIKPNLVMAKLPPAGDFLVSPSPVITVPDYTFSFTNLTLNRDTYKYLWSLGDGSFSETRDVTHKYADTGNYAVSLVVLDTDSNCPDTTIKIVRIDGFPGYVFVPNAFYPNSARNEFRSFKPLGKGLADYQLQIFDSWGKLLFETRLLDATGAPAASWDGTYNGKPMPQDTYAWKIKATFKNGRSWDGMVYTNIPGKTKGVTFGTLTLFR